MRRNWAEEQPSRWFCLRQNPFAAAENGLAFYLSREAQLREHYSQVSDLTRKAKEALLPFVSDLHDVRTLLGTELTVSGVSAAKQTIEKTQDKGAAVRDALTSLTRELNRIEPRFVLARSSSEPNPSANARPPVLRR